MDLKLFEEKQNHLTVFEAKTFLSRLKLCGIDFVSSHSDATNVSVSMFGED
jgi:hypothetical protein